jgi:hypothetical protein
VALRLNEPDVQFIVRSLIKDTREKEEVKEEQITGKQTLEESVSKIKK